jgi:hypothetical protein
MADMVPPEPYQDGVPLLYLELLAESQRNAGEDAVQKYYELRDSRMASVAKGAGAAIVSLLTAWLIPLLKGEYQAHWTLIVGPPFVLLVGLSFAGAYALQNMNFIHRSFIRAMALLQRFR